MEQKQMKQEIKQKEIKLTVIYIKNIFFRTKLLSIFLKFQKSSFTIETA